MTGRRLFGSSQIPHGKGTIHYFTNDKSVSYVNLCNDVALLVKDLFNSFFTDSTGTTTLDSGSKETGRDLVPPSSGKHKTYSSKILIKQSLRVTVNDLMV